MQDNATETAEDQTPTDEGAIADLAARHDPESPRENATKCNTLQQNAALSDKGDLNADAATT